METPTKQKLDSNNYLELWKWFTDDAAKIKDRMWTIATFFYTLLGALLGFVGKELLLDNMCIDNPAFVVLIGVIGCVLSAYGIFMLCKYGHHIRMTWNRADYIRFRIEGLSEIWCYDDPNLIEEDLKLREETPVKIPWVAVWLILIMAIFLLLFLGIILLPLLTRTSCS